MKCNRYIGTGQAANVKPVSRINRACSDHISKNKFRTIRVTSKQVPTMNFKARKTSSMPARIINKNKELTRSIEEKVMTKYISTVKMKNGFLLQIKQFRLNLDCNFFYYRLVGKKMITFIQIQMMVKQ